MLHVQGAPPLVKKEAWQLSVGLEAPEAAHDAPEPEVEPDAVLLARQLACAPIQGLEVEEKDPAPPGVDDAVEVVEEVVLGETKL